MRCAVRRSPYLSPSRCGHCGGRDRLPSSTIPLSPDFPLGVELEVFIRREEAGRFVEEVRGDRPELASKLRIEERELEAGGLN